MGKFTEDMEERGWMQHFHSNSRQLTDVLKEHEAVEKCHICLEKFNNPKDRKVRDHRHYKGLYWGGVHNSCKLKYRMSDQIAIMFHKT